MPQHCGLQLVEAAVATAAQAVGVLGRPSVLAKLCCTGGQGIIAGHDRAAIAQCAQILGRVETERGNIAEAAGASAIALCAMRLCAIFHHLDAACVAERDDGLDLGQLTVQMGHDHGLGRGLARERSLQCGDGHQSRACTGIDEDRRRTTGQNGAGAVHGGIGHHGDPISWPMPSAFSESSRASVPLATLTQWRAPQ